MITAPRVFWPSVILVAVFVTLTAAFTDTVSAAITTIQETVIGTFGWYYILIVCGFVVFAVRMALGRFGDIKLLLATHGHWDHTGAMLRALQMIRDRNGGSEVPVYVHPDMFRTRAAKQPNGTMRLMEDVPSTDALSAFGGAVVNTTERQYLLDELFFVSGDSMLTAVPMTLAPHVSAGEPRPLFPFRAYAMNSSEHYWLPEHDARSFLMIRQSDRRAEDDRLGEDDEDVEEMRPQADGVDRGEGRRPAPQPARASIGRRSTEPRCGGRGVTWGPPVRRPRRRVAAHRVP